VKRSKWTWTRRDDAPPKWNAAHAGSWGPMIGYWHNALYIVMAYDRSTSWGRIVHLAIRKLDNDGPGSDVPWAHKQRIKTELIGPRRVAIELFPSEHELVDEANMYHLWVLPEGTTVPFTLDARRAEPFDDVGELASDGS
jgi:hypothetical protein